MRTLFTLAVAMLLQTAKTAPAATLLGHWDFDAIVNQRVTDRSGNQRHGKIHGAPQVVPGIRGTALQFKSNDDYVDVGVPVVPRRDFTISVWVNCDDTEKQFFMGQYLYGHPERLDLAVRESCVRIQVNTIVDTAKVVEPGKWYHLVYTRGRETLKIYVNGDLVTETLLPGDVIQTESLIIGKIFVPKQDSFRFSGRIDDVKIWDAPLPDAEVKREFLARDARR